jgi:hypothetical protein
MKVFGDDNEVKSFTHILGRKTFISFHFNIQGKARHDPRGAILAEYK